MHKLKEFYNGMLFRLFHIKPKNAGWTSFAPMRIVPEYTVDVEKGQVTGVVKYQDKVYLTVVVDVQKKKTLTRGSLIGILKHTKPFKKHHYIDMIKGEAECLIDNETKHSR